MVAQGRKTRGEHAQKKRKNETDSWVQSGKKNRISNIIHTQVSKTIVLNKPPWCVCLKDAIFNEFWYEKYGVRDTLGTKV